MQLNSLLKNKKRKMLFLILSKIKRKIFFLKNELTRYKIAAEGSYIYCTGSVASLIRSKSMNGVNFFKK